MTPIASREPEISPRVGVSTLGRHGDGEILGTTDRTGETSPGEVTADIEDSPPQRAITGHDDLLCLIASDGEDDDDSVLVAEVVAVDDDDGNEAIAEVVCPDGNENDNAAVLAVQPDSDDGFDVVYDQDSSEGEEEEDSTHSNTARTWVAASLCDASLVGDREVDEDGSFVTEEQTREELTAETAANPYLADLAKASRLKILQEARVKREYDNNGVLGLFYLFISRTWFDSMRGWTNNILESKGLKKVSKVKFQAYIGLEMAMSIVQYNEIAEYWSSSAFRGHRDFFETMSRDDFGRIRRNIVLRSPDTYDHGESVSDPLCHARKLLEHLSKNMASVAVPIGTSALDENTARTKARTTARTYMPSKPDPYGIRFYTTVGSSGVYVHTMWNNGSGNRTNVSKAQDFCRVFREMRTPCHKLFEEDRQSVIDVSSSSALWILQLALQTKRLPDPSGKRVHFMDNFYTRHNLASYLKEMTDGEARVIGTVKFTNVDALNRIHLSAALQKMKEMERGRWLLVKAVDSTVALQKERKKHIATNKKKPARDRVPYMPPENSAATQAGYILWNDNRVVIFYSNDLKTTPKEWITEGSEEEAIECVHGLAKLNRWTGSEMLHRTSMEVPSIIVAYNTYMNSVDRMDQMRATNPTKRKEARLHMTLFTLALDIALNNSYALFRTVNTKPGKTPSFRNFKASVCEMLIEPLRSTRKGGRKNSHSSAIEDVEDGAIQRRSIATNAAIVPRPGRGLPVNHVGGTANPHMIVPNRKRKGIHCHFCLLRNKKRKTIYGCASCQRGFHPECFTAMHYSHVLEGQPKILAELVLQSDKTPTTRGLTKPSRYIAQLSELVFPE